MSARRPPEARRGRALGCGIALQATGEARRAGGAVDAGWDLLDELERRWSRFRPDSLVSRLNAADGEPVRVDTETRDLLRTAVEAWHLTDGRFDPTVLDALEVAGYVRSHELLAPPRHPWAPVAPSLAGEGPQDRAAHRRHRDADPRSSELVATRRQPPWPEAITFDDVAGTAALAPGARLDLGGIGKGRIADLVAERMLAAGAAGALVDLGGDVVVAGEGPDAGAWAVAVEDPCEPERSLATVVLADGAVATSATTRRRWHHDGVDQHHLIDPATGQPSATDVAAATVVAGEATWAEVLAKAAVIAGLAEGVELIVRSGATGLLVTIDGFAVRVAGLEAYEATPAGCPAGEPTFHDLDGGARR